MTIQGNCEGSHSDYPEWNVPRDVQSYPIRCCAAYIRAARKGSTSRTPQARQHSNQCQTKKNAETPPANVVCAHPSSFEGYIGAELSAFYLDQPEVSAGYLVSAD
jgi:hypothetical protein